MELIFGLQLGLMIGAGFGYWGCYKYGKSPVIVKEMDEFEKKIMKNRLEFEQNRVEGLNNILNYNGDNQEQD